MPFLALLDPNPDPPTVSNTKKPLQNEVQFMLMGQGRIRIYYYDFLHLGVGKSVGSK
jgi:hypothetical protein